MTDSYISSDGKSVPFEVAKAYVEDHPELGIRVSRRMASPHLIVAGVDPRRLNVTIGVRFGGTEWKLDPTADHVVAGSTLIRINPGASENLQNLMTAANVQPGEATYGAYLRLVQVANALAVEFADRVEIAPDWFEANGSELFELPPQLAASLYPYQLSGYRFLRALASIGVGALLADEMGLGKTLQAIAFIAAAPERGQTLVVAPASLLANWVRELEVFAPSLTVSVHAGPFRAGVVSSLPKTDVLLSSYETLLNDVSFMKDVEWRAAILDEAQWIKNAESMRSIAVKQLRAHFRVAITGTPVENSTSDLLSIWEFLTSETADFEIPASLTNPQTSAVADQIGRLASPLTIRRRVADVATDLPPLTEALVAVSMSSELASAYQSIGGTNHLTVVQAQSMLCAHAGTDFPLTESPKGERIREMLGEVFGRSEKALIFASYTKALDDLYTLASRLDSRAVTGVVDGRTDPNDRQRFIDEFNAYDGPGCLLLNPRAAGVGLNITSANHVIHFNPEWNPAVTDQATARSYRRRQELPVFVHHLYYDDTIEATAIDRSGMKRDVADVVSARLEEDGAHE